MTVEIKTLLAIVYETDSGANTDRLLTDLANEMQTAGVRLAGTVQRAFQRADRCACDMIVRNLATQEEVKISEDRGVHARGCRLDSGMLEHLVGSTATALEGGVDLLIVNKFGKQESVGAGFRDVIASAVANGIPMVIAVNYAYLDPWRSFASDFADELPPDGTEVRKWLADRLANQSQILWPTLKSDARHLADRGWNSQP